MPWYAACCVLPQWQSRRCSSLRFVQRNHTRTRARAAQERAAQVPTAFWASPPVRAGRAKRGAGRTHKVYSVGC